MGSGHEEEAVQAAFLETALSERDGRATMVFSHMPPFDKDRDDQAITTHCILPEPRRWLLDRCLAHGVTCISAGHIHRHTVRDYRGLPIVTAPATSFVNMPASPPSESAICGQAILWALRCGMACAIRWYGRASSSASTRATGPSRPIHDIHAERPLQAWFG